MSIKKYSSGSWVDIPYRKYGTETDTITSLPADVIADGQSASANIIGNMNQQGTPSPSSIIMPSETGDKTANLSNLYGVDKTALNLRFKTGNNMTITINGTKASGANVVTIAEPDNLTLPAGTYTLYIKMVSGEITNTTEGAFFGINKSTYGYRTTPAVKEVGDIGKRTFTLNEDTVITSFDIAPSYSNVGSIWNAEFECMLVSGSDVPPYQPFGYKIPILCGGTTTNLYLGEVQSTRRIKKLVLTGQEDWTYESSFSRFSTFQILPVSFGARATPMYCSHFRVIDDGRSTADVPNNSCYSGNVGSSGVYFKVESYTSTDDFKAYVAQQYASGTPITLWMILAKPTTGIVNEPIRKIGDYADTVSGITIPTTTGKDSFDVLTTLKPSEVSLAYTGWHDATVKEWGGSEWEGE